MRGRDIIGQAQTGSGKTAAFGLPAVEQIDETSEDIQVLVLTPTRELCIQVAQALRTFSEFKGVRVVACFGGQPIPEQTVQLRQGPQIVVGTPGRVMDLIRRGWLQLSDARYVVLDEADEMLSLGFMEDVEWILKKTPSGRQTLLFSATMPAPIRKLADRYLYEPVHREGGVGDAHGRDDRPGDRRGRAEGQAGRALRRARARPAGRRDRVPPAQDDGRRAGRTAGGARLRRGPAARRHAAGAPRRRDAALPQRPRPAAGRHERRRPRPRHLARLARLLLRRAGRSRGVHAPHRPYGPRRPHRHRLHVHDQSRPQGRGRDRARHGRSRPALHG